MDNMDSTGSFKKRSPAGLEWFKNVGRSLGYAGSDLVQTLTPETSAFLSTNIDYAKELVEAVNDAKSNASGIKDLVGFDKGVELGRDAMKNAIEDIRTGKIYNKERIQEAEMASFADDFDMDFDFDGDVDESTETAAKVNSAIAETQSKATTQPVIASISASSESIVKSIEGSSQAQIGAAQAQIAVVNRTGSLAIKGLESINNNIGLMIRFQDTSMTKYIGASIKYYEDTIKHMENTYNFMTTQKKTEVKRGSDPFKDVFSDIFDAGEYVGNVRKNIKRELENPAVQMLLETLKDDTFVRDLVASPLAGATKHIAKRVIPEMAKSTFGAIDESLNNFVPALFMKINRMVADSGNPILEKLNSIFGIQVGSKGSVDLGRYERGPIPYDGESKKALTEIIPTYLRQITAALTGKKEMAYDWEKGKFRTMEAMKQDYDDMVKSTKQAPFIDLRSEMDENYRDIEKLIVSGKDRKTFRDGLDNFFASLGEQDRLINPELLEDLQSVFSFGNDNMDKMLQELILSTEKRTRTGAFGRGVYEASSNQRRLNEDIQENTSRYNYATLNNQEEDRGARVAGRTDASLGLVDEFGKNSLSYLRDINMTLMGGIPVYLADGGGGKGRRKGQGVPKTPSHIADIRATYKSQELLVEQQRIRQENKDKSQDLSVNDIDRLRDRGEEVYSSFDTISDPSSLINMNRRKKEDMEKDEELNGQGGFRMKLNELVTKPAQMIDAVFRKIDNTLYNAVFGTGDNKQSFLEGTMSAVKSSMDKTAMFARDKIYMPMHEFFFGEKGLVKKADPVFQWVKGKASRFFLGDKGEDGVRRNGLFSNFIGITSDAGKYFRDVFTGKGFTKYNGEVVKADPSKSVIGSMRSFMGTMFEGTKERLLGETDAEGNSTGGMFSFLTDGVEQWRSAIFGPKNKVDTAKFNKETLGKLGEKVREGLPKGIVGGIAGAGVGMGLMQSTGLLGSLFLPGAPMGMAILGGALGFAKSSNRFNDWAFGERHVDGNRLGGKILSENAQIFLKENKNRMVGGATVGAAGFMAKSMLGIGLLPSFLLPGGPFGAAMIGAATGLLTRTNTFKNMMFGKEGEDGTRAGNIITRMFRGLTGKVSKDSVGESNKNMLGTATVGGVGGYALGSVAGALLPSLGIMGSMLSPVAPIGAAIAGTAIGIGMTSEKFHKYIFGTWDPDTAEKTGGIMNRLTNWGKLNILQPLAQKAQEVKLDTAYWLANNIADPIKFAIDPIKRTVTDAIQKTSEVVSSGFAAVTGSVKEGFRNNVSIPLGKAFTNFVFRPMRWTFGKLFDGVLGTTKFIVGAPFKLLDLFSHTRGGYDMVKGQVNHVLDGIRDIVSYRQAKKTTGDRMRLFSQKDSEGNVIDEGLFSKLNKGFNPINVIKDGSFREDGAGYYFRNLMERKLTRADRDEEYKKERERLKEERAKLKKRQKMGLKYGFEDETEEGKSLRRIYNLTKSNSGFNDFVNNTEDSQKVINRDVESILGVTAQQLLGLDASVDITQINGKQRKKLRKFIEKGIKSNLKGDELLKHLGVYSEEKEKAKVEFDQNEMMVKTLSESEKLLRKIEETSFDPTKKEHGDAMTKSYVKALELFFGKKAEGSGEGESSQPKLIPIGEDSDDVSTPVSIPVEQPTTPIEILHDSDEQSPVFGSGVFGRGPKGRNVYYSQGDSRWGNFAMGGDTVKNAGCGPTSAAMIMSSLTGKNVTPVDALEFGRGRGHIHPTMGASSNLFMDMGNAMGVRVGEVPSSEAYARGHLKAGNQLILRGEGGPNFTSSGHYVVARGLSGSKVKINDPLSRARSGSYDLDEVMNNTTNVFSAGPNFGKGNSLSATENNKDESGDFLEDEDKKETLVDIIREAINTSEGVDGGEGEDGEFSANGKSKFFTRSFRNNRRGFTSNLMGRMLSKLTTAITRSIGGLVRKGLSGIANMGQKGMTRMSNSNVGGKGRVGRALGSGVRGIGRAGGRALGFTRGVGGALANALGIGGNVAVVKSTPTAGLGANTRVGRALSGALARAGNMKGPSSHIFKDSGYSAQGSSATAEAINTNAKSLSDKKDLGRHFGRRNVANYIKDKMEQDAATADANYKATTADIQARIETNTRMTAEAVGDTYDLHNGFYNWLRDFLENMYIMLPNMMGGFPGGGGGIMGRPLPLPNPTPAKPKPIPSKAKSPAKSTAVVTQPKPVPIKQTVTEKRTITDRRTVVDQGGLQKTPPHTNPQMSGERLPPFIPLGDRLLGRNRGKEGVPLGIPVDGKRDGPIKEKKTKENENIRKIPKYSDDVSEEREKKGEKDKTKNTPVKDTRPMGPKKKGWLGRLGDVARGRNPDFPDLPPLEPAGGKPKGKFNLPEIFVPTPQMGIVSGRKRGRGVGVGRVAGLAGKAVGGLAKGAGGLAKGALRLGGSFNPVLYGGAMGAYGYNAADRVFDDVAFDEETGQMMATDEQKRASALAHGAIGMMPMLDMIDELTGNKAKKAIANIALEYDHIIVAAKDMASTVWEKTKEFGGWIGDGFGKLKEKMQPALDLAADLFSTVKEKFDGFADMLLDMGIGDLRSGLKGGMAAYTVTKGMRAATKGARLDPSKNKKQPKLVRSTNRGRVVMGHPPSQDPKIDKKNRKVLRRGGGVTGKVVGAIPFVPKKPKTPPKIDTGTPKSSPKGSGGGPGFISGGGGKGAGGLLKGAGKAVLGASPLGALLWGGMGAMDGISKADELFGGEATGAQKTASAIGHGVVGALPIVGMIDSMMGNVMAEGLTKVLGGVTDIFGTMGDAWDSTKEKASQLKDDAVAKWEGAKTWVGDKWSNLKESIGTKAGDMVEGAKEKWEGAKTWVTDKWGDLKEGIGEKAGDMVTKAVTSWSDTNDAIDGKLTELSGEGGPVGFAAKMALTTKNNWMKAATGVAKNLVGLAKDPVGQAKKMASDVKKKWTTAVSGVKSGITNLASNAKKKAKDMATNVKEKWTSTVSGVKGSISKLASNAKEKAKDMATNVKEKWTSTVSGVKTKISSLSTDVGAKATEMVGKVKTGWDNATTAAGTAMSSLKTAVSSAVSNLSSKISGAISGAATRMKNFVFGKGGTYGAGDLSSSKKIPEIKDKGLTTTELESTRRLTGSMLLTDKGRVHESEIIPGYHKIIGQGPLSTFASGDNPKAKTGNDVYYSQKDSEWSDDTMGKGKVKNAGCGPTSAAMIVSSLSDNKITPRDALEFAENRGHVHPELGANSNMFGDIGSASGIPIGEAPNDPRVMKNHLKAGNQLILRGQGGDNYTEGGHYVVATGMSGSNKIKIKDPLGRERSGLFDFKDVVDHTTNTFVAAKDVSSYARGNNLVSGDLIDNANVYGMGVTGEDFIKEGRKYLGTRYHFGGSDLRNGIDCSGFTSKIIEIVTGIRIPQGTVYQIKDKLLEDVPASDVRVGDLVFFNGTNASRGLSKVSHVGFVASKNTMLNSAGSGYIPNSNGGVKFSDFTSSYWAPKIMKYRRVKGVTPGPPAGSVPSPTNETGGSTIGGAIVGAMQGPAPSIFAQFESGISTIVNNLYSGQSNPIVDLMEQWRSGGNLGGVGGSSSGGYKSSIIPNNLQEEIAVKTLELTANNETGGDYTSVKNDMTGDGKKISPSFGLLQWRGAKAKQLMDIIRQKAPNAPNQDVVSSINYNDRTPWSQDKINKVKAFMTHDMNATKQATDQIALQHVKDVNLSRVYRDFVDAGILKDPRSISMLGDFAQTGPANITTLSRSFNRNTPDNLTSMMNEFNSKSYWGKRQNVYGGRIKKNLNELSGWQPKFAGEGVHGAGDGIISIGKSEFQPQTLKPRNPAVFPKFTPPPIKISGGVFGKGKGNEAIKKDGRSVMDKLKQVNMNMVDVEGFHDAMVDTSSDVYGKGGATVNVNKIKSLPISTAERQRLHSTVQNKVTNLKIDGGNDELIRVLISLVEIIADNTSDISDIYEFIKSGGLNGTTLVGVNGDSPQQNTSDVRTKELGNNRNNENLQLLKKMSMLVEGRK